MKDPAACPLLKLRWGVNSAVNPVHVESNHRHVVGGEKEKKTSTERAHNWGNMSHPRYTRSTTVLVCALVPRKDLIYKDFQLRDMGTEGLEKDGVDQRAYTNWYVPIFPNTSPKIGRGTLG